MKYTTLENLTRKLKGRLNIGETDNLTIYPNDTPGQLVDNELISLIAEQKEIFVDYILDQLYILPLRYEHPVVTDIVDSLIISDLLLIHFQGSGGYGGLSADISGQGNALKSHAYQLLGMLTAGLNFSIAGMPAQTYYPGTLPPRRMELRNEIPRNTPPTQIIVNNETLVGKLEDESKLNDFVEDNDVYNPFSNDYKTNTYFDYENYT